MSYLKRAEVDKRRGWEGALQGREEIRLVKCCSHKQSIARTVKINSSIHTYWQWIPAKLNRSKTFNLDLCGTILFSSPAYKCSASSFPGNSQLHYVCPAFIFLWTNTSFKSQNTSNSSFRTLRDFFVSLCLFACLAVWRVLVFIHWIYSVKHRPHNLLPCNVLRDISRTK